MRCRIYAARAPGTGLGEAFLSLNGRHYNPLKLAPRIRRSAPPTLNSANLMLDEPPLIVRTRDSAGFMAGSFVILQSERRQLRARRPVVHVKNAANSQTFGDLDKH